MIDRGVRTRGEGGEALVTLVIFVTILYRHEGSNKIMLNISNPHVNISQNRA